MKKQLISFTAICAFLVCFGVSAQAWAAGTCNVSSSAGDNTQHSLLYEYANLVAGNCTNNVITFDSGITQITLNSAIELYGALRIQGKVVNGKPVPLIKAGSSVTTADFIRISGAKTGSAATLENVAIQAAGKTAVNLMKTATGHILKGVEISNSKYGVMISGNNNAILTSKIHNNTVEGVKVDTGDFNQITKTAFAANAGIGIDLVNTGNQNKLRPEDMKVVADGNGSYLVTGTVEDGTTKVELFLADADAREGKEYIDTIDLVNPDANTKVEPFGSGTVIVFAKKIVSTKLNGADVTATTFDSQNNTSEFADGSTTTTEDATQCFDKFDAQAYPDGNYCGKEEEVDCTPKEWRCSDIESKTGCEDEYANCCTDHPELCRIFVPGPGPIITLCPTDYSQFECKDMSDFCKPYCCAAKPNDTACTTPTCPLTYTDGCAAASADCKADCCAKNPTDAACGSTTCPDVDKDKICDDVDNCPEVSNPGQVNETAGSRGDICETPLMIDTCTPYWQLAMDTGVPEATQTEANRLLKTCCDMPAHKDDQVCQYSECVMAKIIIATFKLADTDGDGIVDSKDNCPLKANGICSGPDNQKDSDGDRAGDICDNCPLPNADQVDVNANGVGDACEKDNWEDADWDHDGVLNKTDNCITDPNPSQGDVDGDKAGDSCDDDIDGDTINNYADNCPAKPNTDQADTDGDGVGDVCDPVNGAILNEDADSDGVDNIADNCPVVPNPDQADKDADGVGDKCDSIDNTLIISDSDKDGINNTDDNCPLVPNPDQNNIDGDAFGDACDSDMDGDGVPNDNDNCIAVPNPGQADTDKDGIGDACDNNNATFPDYDKDGVPDVNDNCIATPNTDQMDSDSDGVGDKCDSMDNVSIQILIYEINKSAHDLDEDGIDNKDDNCVLEPNADQADADGDGIGDACEGQVYTGDLDGDNIADQIDNCPAIYNPDQDDINGTDDTGDVGDACEGTGNIFIDTSVLYDIDGDGVPNFITECQHAYCPVDNCPFVFNDQLDSDGDWIGDACDIDNIYLPPDEDLDGDGVLNKVDNCPAIDNPGQENSDSGQNAIGDACQLIVIIYDDNDLDGDGVVNHDDNCVTVKNPDQADTGGTSGVGDACDQAAADIGGTPPNTDEAGNWDLNGSGGVQHNGSSCSMTGNASAEGSMAAMFMIIATILAFTNLRIRRPGDATKRDGAILGEQI